MADHPAQPQAQNRLRHPDPYVEFFINVDPEPVLVLQGWSRLLQPSDHKAHAVVTLQEASLGLRSDVEAIAALEAGYHQKSHIDLHILLLLAWGRLLLYEDKQGPHTVVVANQIASLITKHTPAEIRAWANYHEAAVRFHANDVVGFERRVAQMPGDLPPDSAHYRRFLLLQAMDHFEVGKGALVEDALRELVIGAGLVYEKRLAKLRMINSAMVGSFTEEDLLAPDLALDSSVRAYKFQALAVAQQVIRLLAEHAGLRKSDNSGKPEPEWLLSARALLAHDLDGALHWARKHADQKPSRETMIAFDAYTLIRAELACRHGEAALGLLRTRGEHGTVQYFDDLFYARAHLLLGNKQQAAEHFARLQQAVHTYGADGRLDFELRLAAELSAIDLIALSRAADRVGPQRASVAPPPARTEQRRGIDSLISGAREMQAVKELIERFADVDVPCLITGETGTGKERVAQALHESSARRAQPFVEINCGALSDTLIESELFGHKRGAFTGAQTAHPGLFREAGAGTIFLDEIGEISPKLQMALLRVLETGEARAVGGSESYTIRCRIIAATNADLARRVEEGRFRADLMYRLERLQIHLPPLRSRPDDIVILAEHFLNLRRPESKVAVLLPRLKARLRDYAWPGNVRELRNVIERMRILNSDKLQYDVNDLDSFSSRRTSLADAGDQEFLPRAASAGAHAAALPPDKAPASAPGMATPAASPTREMRRGEEIASFLDHADSSFRRLDRLRAIFVEFPKLKVSEVAKILGVSRATAARYLEVLSAEGTVKKVCPTASRRSQYYLHIGSTPTLPE